MHCCDASQEPLVPEWGAMRLQASFDRSCLRCSGVLRGHTAEQHYTHQAVRQHLSSRCGDSLGRLLAEHSDRPACTFGLPCSLLSVIPGVAAALVPCRGTTATMPNKNNMLQVPVIWVVPALRRAACEIMCWCSCVSKVSNRLLLQYCRVASGEPALVLCRVAQRQVD